MRNNTQAKRQRKLAALEKKLDPRGEAFRVFQDDKRTIRESLRNREIDHDDSMHLYDAAKARYDNVVAEQRAKDIAEQRKPNDNDARNATIFVAVVVIGWLVYFFS